MCAKTHIPDKSPQNDPALLKRQCRNSLSGVPIVFRRVVYRGGY